MNHNYSLCNETKLNLKILYCLTFLLLATYPCLCQNRADTIYYNTNWEIVNNIKIASYYRVIQIADSNGYLFTDYYITGEQQGRGRFLSMGETSDITTIFDGPVTSFYKDGKTHFETTYSDGKYNGDYIEYANDGHITKKIRFNNGVLDGPVYIELSNGNRFLSEVSNGLPLKPYYLIQTKNGKEYKIDYSGNEIALDMPDISGRKTFYRNGNAWQYYVINGVTYALSLSEVNEYGKWFMVQIAITNDSPTYTTFDATDISATIIKKNNWTESIDTLHKNAIKADEYLTKVDSRQEWQTFLYSLAEGLTSASSAYSTTYTNTYTYGNGGHYFSQSTSTTYNPAAANIAHQASAQRISNFESAQWEQRKAISEGYLRRNTIFPEEILKGFVLIERPRHYDIINILVSIGDIQLIYGWKGSSK